MMRTLALLGLLGTVAGQAGESNSYDAMVAALCDVSEGATAQGNPPAALQSSNIVQTGGTKVQVSAPGTPDAVWLTDVHGMILNYLASPSLPIELDFGDSASVLRLYAHYSSCYTTSASADTWMKKYNDYVTEDSLSYSSTLSAEDIAATAPTFSTVNYNAKTAEVTFNQQAGIGVPYAYVKDQNGLVLAFHDEWASAPGGNTPRSISVAIPTSAMSLTACTLSCTTHELSADIVASISAAPGQLNLCATADCALPTEFDDETLSVSKSADCTSSEYALYATGVGGAVLAYGSNQALTVRVEGLSTVTLNQMCGGALSAMSVDIDVLRSTYTSSVNGTTVAPVTAAPPVTCVYEGRTYNFNEVWNGPKGQSCICVQGETQCGGGYTNGVYFDTGELVAVVICIFIIALVLGSFARYKFLANDAVVRRKSVAGQTYGVMERPGQDIELPPSNI